MPEFKILGFLKSIRQRLVGSKKRLVVLLFILAVIPLTVILALTQQNFFKFADAGAVIEYVEIHPGVISIDVNSTSPIQLSALAYDSFSDPIFYLDDIIYEWSMSSTNTVGTLLRTDGQISEFKPLSYGCGELTVTARWAQEIVMKSISVAVSDGANIPNCSYAPPPISSTPTPAGESSILNFQSVKLHGIGQGGDNTNASIAGNLNPIRTTRNINVELENGEGETFLVEDGSVVYNEVPGVFSGNIVLPSSISTGNYLIKIKSPQYLKKQLKGIITITQGEEIDINEFSLITGDIDSDNSLTLSDYNMLIDCYSDLLPARDCVDENKKISADLSDDGQVNADDYNLFLRELSVVSGD